MSAPTEVARGSTEVVVLAPTGHDAEVLVRTLTGANIASRACSSMAELCAAIRAGIGAAIIAGESLRGPDKLELERTLSDQPEWSHLPLIIMATGQREAGPGWQFVRACPQANTLILERPVYGDTLLSAVRSAERSRLRQYEVRDELAARRRAEHALRESDRRKDDFLAMLGHELRNPLAAIRSATDLVGLVGREDRRLARAHAVLERQTTQMARLIDGLLDVSRIARGKIDLHRQILDLRVVVEEVVQDHAATMARRGLSLVTDLPTTPAWVDGDPVRLAQVLSNLVSNAIKFTSTPGRIALRLVADEQQVEVRVTDTGRGIRPELLTSIFEPFRQEEQEGARPAGGLGLGLAVAKGLVELHRGSIGAHSDGPDRGAELTVRLPVASPPSAGRISDRHAALEPRRVLLVEDAADAAEMACELLQAQGHQVQVARTGEEALAELRRSPADVVLCDIGLPGMSGHDVARRIRSDDRWHDVALVAISGYGRDEDRRQAAEAGFDAYLTKPVELDQLGDLLRRLERNRR